MKPSMHEKGSGRVGKFRPFLYCIWTISCCGIEKKCEYESEAVVWLLAHNHQDHRALLKKIEKKARKLARSQNGRGYYDANDKDTGWQRAQPTFREAWRMQALKEILRESQRTTRS